MSETVDNTKVDEKYEEYMCSIHLFRYFLRKIYKGVKISNEDCDGLRIEFGKYLHDLGLNDLQKKYILLPSELEVIMNADKPFNVNGFPAAYVFHFTLFVEKMKKACDELEEDKK